MMKRLFAGALAGVTILGLAACAAPAVQRGAAETEKTAAMTETAVYGAAKNPKYVFLFIGDGMKLSADSIHLRLSRRVAGCGLPAGAAQPG